MESGRSPDELAFNALPAPRGYRLFPCAVTIVRCPELLTSATGAMFQ
jgi:hypothetical protein